LVNLCDYSAQRFLERGDFIPDLEVFEPGEFLQSCSQSNLINLGYAGDEVGDERSKLLFSHSRDIGKEGITETASQFSEGISVEKEKRGLSVEFLQMPNDLKKGQSFFLETFPFLLTRRVTFRIRAVLSTLSLAESSVEVGDSLPIPVFEKTGSAL